MRIGQLARLTHLSPDTLRHYERLGLFTTDGRTIGGYRLYGTAAIRQVAVVQAALGIGFTLRELSSVFAERRAGKAPCQRVRAIASEKLAQLDAQLRNLNTARRDLKRAVAKWDRRLAGAAPGHPVRLLELLGEAFSRRERRTSTTLPAGRFGKHPGAAR